MVYTRFDANLFLSAHWVLVVAFDGMDETGLMEQRPRITCADGFSFSMQSGALLYSEPRDNTGPYTKVEVGYPSQSEDMWLEYAEEIEIPTETVYPYLPVALIEEAVEKHGGVPGFLPCGLIVGVSDKDARWQASP